MRYFFLLLFSSFFCAYALELDNESSNTQKFNTFDEVQKAIHKALELELYKQKQWLDLIHFRGRKRKVGEIDSPIFYLAKEKNKKGVEILLGKKDAKAELVATIRAFYERVDSIQPSEELRENTISASDFINSKLTALPQNTIKNDDFHAICRFPARFAYLDSVLHFEGLDKPDCAEFNNMKKYISPKSVSIVFPSAHVNSPASMFGHTFLLFNSSFNSRLLSFALNYQAEANPNEENAISFAFKGLAGGYEGRFSILPYYDKLKEYIDLESRDTWEFDLDFTQEEVERMYAHTWELKDAYSWYYYIDENCSYNLMWLFEVARPSLILREKFFFFVNPIETIFELRNAGLIIKEAYRPSKRAIITSYEKMLKSKDVRMAKKLSTGAIKSEEVMQNPHLNLQEKQLILESANEMSEFLYMKGKLKSDYYADIVYEIASARAKLGDSPKPFLPLPYSPLFSHRSTRLSLAYAHTHNSRGFNQGLNIDFRLFFHDFSDNDVGYLSGVQIEFMRFAAFLGLNNVINQGKFAKNDLYLEEVKFISFASLGFIGKFFKPLSYRGTFGLNRMFLDDGLSLHFTLGVGLSHQFGAINSLNGYVYYLLEPSVFASNGANVALANVLGASLSYKKPFKIYTEYKLRHFERWVMGEEILFSVSYSLKSNFSIFTQFQYLRLPSPYLSRQNFQFGVKIYF